jgi:hypothetical protein
MEYLELYLFSCLARYALRRVRQCTLLPCHNNGQKVGDEQKAN